jgi:quercetin dioxygenase-like cupin family protein
MFQEITMSRISRSEPLTHPRLPGVTVFAFTEDLHRGAPQEVLVEMAPGSEIPLHSHAVDATMLVVDGEARVLSSDPQLHGQTVHRGDVVFFERDVNHGFVASDRGMVFVSNNGGIVVQDSGAWDMTFA